MRRGIVRAFMIIAMVATLTTATPPEQRASACGDWCICETAFHGVLRSAMAMEATATAAWITLNFELHRELFWDEWMWGFNIGNALMMWTQELNTAAMLEMFAIGGFFDAKHQIETQRLLQTKHADAFRDYRPDVGMCTIGTIARGLGQTSRNGELVAHGIVENQIDRLLSSRNSSARSGDSSDKEARVRQLRARFCDARDSAGLMGSALCNPAPAVIGRNRDVDFNMTVMEPLTIDVYLGDGAPATGPEQDVMALASNLYAHKVMTPFPDHLMNDTRGRSYILDQRAIAAKRSVAAYSFGSIVGLKAGGTGGTNAPYLRAVLEQLGAPNADTTSYLGARPSYYAQMELLTKKIYQDPEFYTNLYESPANVERKSAAIRALRMVQDMDRFNSVLRSEQSLSVLLELYIEDMQKDVINTDGAMGE